MFEFGASLKLVKLDGKTLRSRADLRVSSEVIFVLWNEHLINLKVMIKNEKDIYFLKSVVGQNYDNGEKNKFLSYLKI